MTEQGQQLTFSDIFKNKFLEAFSLSSPNMTLPNIILMLLAAFALGLFIYFVYKKTYRGVLFSPTFAGALVLLTMVTALIIMCISANVVLSLGMVGALSIVRFRTAVKDPMDTVYMFWAIAVGIVVGANFILYAIIGSAIIGLVVFLLAFLGKVAKQNYLLVIHFDERVSRDVAATIRQLQSQKLKSKTVNRNGIEATYEVRLSQGQDNVVEALLHLPGVHDATLVSFQNNIA